MRRTVTLVILACLRGTVLQVSRCYACNRYRIGARVPIGAGVTIRRCIGGQTPDCVSIQVRCRTRCSEMRSCDEATYFIKNCRTQDGRRQRRIRARVSGVVCGAEFLALQSDHESVQLSGPATMRTRLARVGFLRQSKSECGARSTSDFAHTSRRALTMRWTIASRRCSRIFMRHAAWKTRRDGRCNVSKPTRYRDLVKRCDRSSRPRTTISVAKPCRCTSRVVDQVIQLAASSLIAACSRQVR